MLSMFFGSFGFLGLLGGAFWIWMLYECLKGGRRSQRWIWPLLFLNVIGAAMYFVIEWLPQHPDFLGKLGIFNQRKMRDRLWQAEADARNIGNATQFITLGNLLFDMQETQKAYDAYLRALEKEPKEPKAVWGAFQCSKELKDYETAKSYIETLLKVKPDYGYGEASLAYGELLYQMKDYDAAAVHLQGHLKEWSTPSGYLMLADIQEKQSDVEAARKTLETLIIKVKGFVPFQYRKNEHFIRKAERRLKGLPKASA